MPSNSHSITTNLSRGLAGLLLTLSSLITAFWISWHGLAQANFGYSLGYELLEIEHHIQRFGPTNQYRKDFEFTSTEQHMRLFAEIVTAIQDGGHGLDQIQYSRPNGVSETLLRPPEVVHLQDVANLIRLFNQVAIVCVILMIGLAVVYRRLGWSAPGARQILVGTLLALLVVGLMLMLVGPTQSFYWLHTQVFPKDHQWFFYYQESLMTTLMKAPDLFGFIAALWAVPGLTLFGLSQWALNKGLQSR
ncbi:DUF1461 domain-containing protein [Ketobacter sp.]|uniref:lipoprotein intramolecular transacylase Lit n=1 Tax=Ketobacter sp. TaxID=2083498 RepID=UPI000F1A4556|nr:DUF1461 domain-containing protein [Ketobacter sp.]RLU00265.1 MAG: DUF1461 domain-containing protein [Ketobacter sp.]